MTDAERWTYFTDVMNQLEALRLNAPEDRELSALTMQAGNAINSVLEHFIPAREEAAPVFGPAIKDPDLEKFRERMAAKIAEIKGAFMRWLEPRDSEANGVCITKALLEIALDRHVAVHHADGFDLIEAAYRRAVQSWRGRLQ
jgi:hypothetical protein